MTPPPNAAPSPVAVLAPPPVRAQTPARGLRRGPPSSREADAFGLRFAPADAGHPHVRALHALLCAAPVAAPPPGAPDADLREAQQAWAEALVGWLRGPRLRELCYAGEPGTGVSAAHTRLAFLVHVLAGAPDLRAAAGRVVRALAADASGLHLFAEAGLPSGHGLVMEALERLGRKVLPEPPAHRSLAQLLLRLFGTEEGEAWLRALPPGPVAALAALLLEGAVAPEPDAAARVRASVTDALALVGVHVASLGLAQDVRERSPEGPGFRGSPFLRLRRACDAALARDAAADTLAELALAGAECRAVLGAVRAHLQERGVSVDLVYRLERLRRGLDRLDALARVLGAPRGEERWREALALVADLLAGAREDRSLRALARTSARLLARRVAERAGESGEHYVTSSRAEWHGMVHSAAGGGLLTAFTATAKALMAGAALAPFFAALLPTVNYAASFLLMQALGFTLATKQPSMTAATLAAAVDEGAGEGRLDRLVALVPRVVRSQLAAILGNLSAVLPVAAALALGWQLVAGAPLMGEAKALATVAALHPWHTGTLAWAALTGVLLWGASVLGGWVDNWVVYRQLPEALAHHRGLRRVLGPARAARLGAALQRHAGPAGSSVALAVLLAWTPAVGAFFGVPLDVRHVTLSLGGLALAGVSLGPEAVVAPGFAAALGGVLAIGALNFTVSFALALFVALRARAVRPGTTRALVRGLLRQGLLQPRSFVLPPPEEDAVPAPARAHE